MRLLTNDEMIAVSGGSITGYDDPNCLSGKADYSPAAMTKACPGGWEIIGGTTSISPQSGFSRTGRTIKCDTETENQSSEDSTEDTKETSDDTSRDSSGSDTGSQNDD